MAMIRCILPPLAAILFMASAAAFPAHGNAAPTADSPKQPDIVVNAATKERIDTFIDNITDPDRPSRQLARWEGTVCSGIIGLQPDQAEYLNARLGEIGRTIGLHLGKEGCDPSILIIFSPHPDLVAQALVHLYPISLRSDGSEKLKLFVRTTAPVRWITATDTAPVGVARTPYIGGFQPVRDGSLPQATRLRSNVRAVSIMMITIVDSTRLRIMTMRQLADYLVMLTLARPRLGSAAPAQSILSLFEEGGSPPPGLTTYDTAYLTGLYTAPVDLKATSQKSSIRRTMIRSIGNASGS